MPRVNDVHHLEFDARCFLCCDYTCEGSFRQCQVLKTLPVGGTDEELSQEPCGKKGPPGGGGGGVAASPADGGDVCERASETW